MADSDVTRKLQAYRALYRVNRAFARITRNLDAHGKPAWYGGWRHDAPGPNSGDEGVLDIYYPNRKKRRR